MFESLASRPLTFELLYRLAQGMNFSGPSILVGGLARLGTQCACEREVPLLLRLKAPSVTVVPLTP